MDSQIVKIALAQFDNVPMDIHKTIKKMESIVEKASQKKVDFIVFPELFLTGYDLRWIMEEKNNHIFRLNDDNIYSICKLAKNYNISLLVGLPLKMENSYYISALYINSKGKVEKTIFKNYLYGGENNFFTPGTEAEIITVNGFRIGMGICFDSAHTEHINSLKNKGMDIFIGSSLYGIDNGKSEMISNFSQISTKNNILSAVVNYAFRTGEWFSCGNTSFYDTKGNIYKKLKQGEECLLISQIKKVEEKCKYI